MMLRAAMKTSVKLLLLGLLSAWTIQPLHAQVSVGYGLGAQTAAAWTSNTALNTQIAIPINVTPTALVAFNSSGTISTGGVFFEITTAPDGNSNWQQATCFRMGVIPQFDNTYTLSGLNQMWQCVVAGATNFRVRLNPVITGSGTANFTLQGTSGNAQTISAISERTPRIASQSNPAAGSQATISRAAGAAGVRHVADCISFAASSVVAPALTALTINLRDGATGAGTILQTWTVAISAATGQNVAPFGMCGLSLPGSAATAMTLEFSAALANLSQSVSLTTFDVQ